MIYRICLKILDRVAPIARTSTEADRRGEEAWHNARRATVWHSKMGHFERIALGMTDPIPCETIESVSAIFNQLFCGGNTP